MKPTNEQLERIVTVMTGSRLAGPETYRVAMDLWDLIVSMHSMRPVESESTCPQCGRLYYSEADARVCHYTQACQASARPTEPEPKP